MENSKLAVKLSDGTSYDVIFANESYNAFNQMYIFAFAIPLSHQRIEDLLKQLTQENISKITVMENGKNLEIFEGYTEVQSIDKNIDRQNRQLMIRLSKQSNPE